VGAYSAVPNCGVPAVRLSDMAGKYHILEFIYMKFTWITVLYINSSHLLLAAKPSLPAWRHGLFELLEQVYLALQNFALC
jgi:hypothetical protein